MSDFVGELRELLNRCLYKFTFEDSIPQYFFVNSREYYLVNAVVKAGLWQPLKTEKITLDKFRDFQNILVREAGLRIEDANEILNIWLQALGKDIVTPEAITKEKEERKSLRAAKKELRNSCIPNQKKQAVELTKKYLKAAEIQFASKDSSLEASPDLILQKVKAVIYINDCIEYGHTGFQCSVAADADADTELYVKRARANTAKQEAEIKKLEETGWSIIKLWACEFDSARLMTTLKKLDAQAAEAKKNYELQKQKSRRNNQPKMKKDDSSLLIADGMEYFELL